MRPLIVFYLLRPIQMSTKLVNHRVTIPEHPGGEVYFTIALSL